MSLIAANMEWLFTEAGDSISERIHAAAAHGLNAVEMWGWRDKNLDDIRKALDETGITLLSMIVDPQLQLTDPATHDEYLIGVRQSLHVAQHLNAPYLVVVAGQEIPVVDRANQHAAVVSVLSRAAKLLEGSDVTLLLENLNSRIDHVGTYLDATSEGLAIVREVGSAHLRLLLDAYHALVMGENLVSEIGDDIHLISHVQVAEAPGRHEPGTGAIDWEAQFRILRNLGYTGYWGMEYLPQSDTITSLATVEQIVRRVENNQGRTS